MWIFIKIEDTRYREEVRLSGAAKEYHRRYLRHNFAKNLVEIGTPIDQIATLLGYESLDKSRIYTHPSERDLARAVKIALAEIID